MLLFRSGEHVDRWCEEWAQPRGAQLALPHAWALAVAWHGVDRREAAWRRRSVEETEALLASLALTGEFWALR